MERKTRICAVCRNEYKFCNKCSEDADKPNWYFSFCSENCKDIYSITSDFENGLITDLQAKNKIKNCNLTYMQNFGDSYKNSIAKIMEAKEKIVLPVKDIENEKKEIVKPKNNKKVKTLNSDFEKF